MAHTSGTGNAGSDAANEVEIVANGQIRSVRLPNLPHNDYPPHKSDLWMLRLSSSFGFSGCIREDDIQSITIEQNSNDGWNIDSIITILRDDYGTGKYYEVATMDMDVNRWIDGDGHWTHRRFELFMLI